MQYMLLEGGKFQLFIQGSLGKMIKENLTDKGKIIWTMVALLEDFGSSQKG